MIIRSLSKIRFRRFNSHHLSRMFTIVGTSWRKAVSSPWRESYLMSLKWSNSTQQLSTRIQIIMTQRGCQIRMRWSLKTIISCQKCPRLRPSSHKTKTLQSPLKVRRVFNLMIRIKIILTMTIQLWWMRRYSWHVITRSSPWIMSCSAKLLKSWRLLSKIKWPSLTRSRTVNSTPPKVYLSYLPMTD